MRRIDRTIQACLMLVLKTQHQPNTGKIFLREKSKYSSSLQNTRFEGLHEKTCLAWFDPRNIYVLTATHNFWESVEKVRSSALQRPSLVVGSQKSYLQLAVNCSCGHCFLKTLSVIELQMPPVTTGSADSQESSAAAMLKERRFKLSRHSQARKGLRPMSCDEGHPCQACLAASSACTFEEPGKRTHPHKSKRTATLEDRMHHLETLIQAIPPAVFAAGNAGIVPTSVSPANDGIPASPVAPFMFPSFPAGVPPPSLNIFPLTNPSGHFTPTEIKQDESLMSVQLGPDASPDQLAEETSRLSLSASYLYFDDEGYTRWQGEASGLPLLDLLVERHVPSSDAAPPNVAPVEQDWFPNRTPRRTDVNPQTLWRLITSYIAPELMDSLVQCYLSTSSYILPFLHVPTFLSVATRPRSRATQLRPYLYLLARARAMFKNNFVWGLTAGWGRKMDFGTCAEAFYRP
ncbi:hypothetical protein R3P38DRAFT_3361005 [Favolaschia claudopus]|uniref:Zn(2)-C6 fungal-type domain-containing protein n=1 Tax=Favolaschia claudopus TaxID=2862362 RepID=A0AAW0AUX8_9AGAR